MTHNTNQEGKENWKERFDEKFGKPTEEELSNALEQELNPKRMNRAGCDNCDYNIWWREQIKKFIESEITQAKGEGRKKAVEEGFWKGYETGVDIQIPRKYLDNDELSYTHEELKKLTQPNN